MSQVPSQIYDPNLVSISFAKFSHNTSPYGTRNFIWNHIGQRDDLDLIILNNRVIDEQGNYATRVMLKITAGVDVLETQDLGELVNFTRDFDPSSGAEHPVQVVTRCPFMAMKYPKTINAVRRIQLKFRNEDDFKKALNILKDLGFPITESGPNAASVSRPSISPAQLPFSSIPTPNPLISCLPPSSALPCLAARGTVPPISGFKIPTRPDTRNSETPRPSSAQSFSATFDRPVSASTTFSAPTPPSSVSAISPLYNVRSHASLLYPIQDDGGSETPLAYAAVRTTTTPSNPTQSRFYQLHDQHQHRPLESYDRAQRPNSLLIASPFFSARPSEEPLNPPPIDVDRLPNTNSQTIDLLHCARSAPNILELTDKSHDLLPPKRELPFPKRRDGDRGQPSPKSDLRPLPTPTPVRKAGSPKNNTVPENKNKNASTPTPKLARKRVAQRKPAIKKPPEAKLPTKQGPETSTVINSNTDREGAGLEDEVSPLAAKSSATRPSSANSGLQSKASATKKRSTPARPVSSTKRPKMVDQCTQTQTLSGRDHTTALVMISNNESSASITTAEPPPPSPQSYLDLLDTFMRRHRSGPVPKELGEGPGYVDGSEDQRQAILNDFICENLENPEFLQLCEDTEKAWRRIGLGM